MHYDPRLDFSRGEWASDWRHGEHAEASFANRRAWLTECQAERFWVRWYREMLLRYGHFPNEKGDRP